MVNNRKYSMDNKKSVLFIKIIHASKGVDAVCEKMCLILKDFSCEIQNLGDRLLTIR